MTKTMLGDTQFGPAANYFFKGMAAGAEIASRAHLNHERPGYEIDDTLVEGRTVPVIRRNCARHALRQSRCIFARIPTCPSRAC